MTTEIEPGESTSLSPEEAFDIVGNETRLQILHTLGEADEPLTYSELFDRIEYDDSANFTYHLQKLVGHFVRKTDEGYLLRLAGRRAIEAIFSGVVTVNPVVERTEVDASCMYCGAPVEMGYHDEVVLLYCTECAGQIEKKRPAPERWPISLTDIVGYVSLPPAGVYDRTPEEILEAAGINTISGIQSIVRGVCPQCSATVDRTIAVCEDHDSADEFCGSCGHQFGVVVTVRCTNCIFRTSSPFPTHALGNTELMGFMIEHGIDPISPDGFHLSACDEAILSTDPLEARYTFSAEGDSITLHVDEEFPELEVSRE